MHRHVVLMSIVWSIGIPMAVIQTTAPTLWELTLTKGTPLSSTSTLWGMPRAGWLWGSPKLPIWWDWGKDNTATDAHLSTDTVSLCSWNQIYLAVASITVRCARWLWTLTALPSLEPIHWTTQKQRLLETLFVCTIPPSILLWVHNQLHWCVYRDFCGDLYSLGNRFTYTSFLIQSDVVQYSGDYMDGRIICVWVGYTWWQCVCSCRYCMCMQRIQLLWHFLSCAVLVDWLKESTPVHKTCYWTRTTTCSLVSGTDPEVKPYSY